MRRWRIQGIVLTEGITFINPCLQCLHKVDLLIELLLPISTFDSNLTFLQQIFDLLVVVNKCIMQII